ncbi:Fc.00g032110.m01.CDS01 [Cosmosporella sp. VM-42]
MHFAYPPRKSSNPPPFRPRSSKLPALHRNRRRTLALILLVLIGAFYFLFGSDGKPAYHEHEPTGNPPVVIVTVTDPTTYGNAYLQTIKDNRELYASKHGYEAMTVKSLDYDTHGSPQTWAKIFAVRHALSLYPDTKWVWLLDQNAYIMDINKSLEEQILNTKKLDSQMIKDYPIVPPDSIIKTFAHMKAEDANLIISQDKSGLVANSVLIRNGDWAKYFVETWMDPLYRSYNFQKAERHALEHIVQWHPTILSKLALIPQRTLASYTHMDLGVPYQEGDFVVMMAGCKDMGVERCQAEADFFAKKLDLKFGKLAATKKQQ